MPIDEQFQSLGNERFAPAGDYFLGFDANGQVTFVPTNKLEKASNYVDIPFEQTVGPEYFVYPRGKVKMLIGPDGKPAPSVDAVKIVNEEQYIPNNNYGRYMYEKGVLPKDNLVEHLLQRYKANLAGERSDLSPFFANLLTAMYATASREGWTDILNGKYFTGASEVLSPLMFGESAWNKVAQGIYGGVHLLNENGVPKTWREIKEGNYGNAALSAAGDALNLTMAKIGGNKAYNFGVDQLASQGNKWARARTISRELNLNIRGTQLQLNPRSISVLHEVDPISGNSDAHYILYNEFGEPMGDSFVAPDVDGVRYVNAIGSKNIGRGVSEDVFNTAIGDTESGLRIGNTIMYSPQKTLSTTGKMHYIQEGYNEEGQPIRRLIGGSNKPLPQRVTGDHVIELSTPEEDIVFNELTGEFEVGLLKLPRMFTTGDYPIYTGPRHSVSEIVNADGTVNPRAAILLEREVADYFKLFGKGAYRMEERAENPEWHILDPNTYLHTRNVARSAYLLPTPPGFTKQDQMVAALGHDLGKVVAGDGHAEVGAALVKQIFPDATPEQITAILEHMESNPSSVLGQYTKAADILNGGSRVGELLASEPELYSRITGVNRVVEPSGKIRLQLPSHTKAAPREFTIEPAGDNKFYIHMRTWDDVLNHVPASDLTPELKKSLFNAVYDSLPEGAEILLPESGPDNYATRGTIAGLLQLSRDPRFRRGTPGVVLYKDNGVIKTFNGTSFIKDSGSSRISDPHFFSGQYNPTTHLRANITGDVESNPMLTRLDRLQSKADLAEKAKTDDSARVLYESLYGSYEFELPQQSLVVAPKIRYNLIRSAMKRIDPELSEADLNTAIRIVMKNRQGVHFNLASDTTGETIGGVGLVDIGEAVNLVRNLNGRKAIPKDIYMIAGHEFGHGVEVPPEILESFRSLGYDAPEELITQAGQVLDNANMINGVREIEPSLFSALMDKYLSEGNVDNGISRLKNWFNGLTENLKKFVTKQISRFSIGILGMFGLNKLRNNEKVS